MSKPSAAGAQLELLEGGIRVSGVLDATSVGRLLEQSRGSFTRGSGELRVDLAGVTEADSAALALLIEWLRHAKASHRTIRFENPPAQVLALARISEVEQLLFGV